MSLLKESKRKNYLKLLGYEYTTEGIYKFQKKYFPAAYVDGKYGKQTDILLRHCYNVKMYAPHFKPEDFKCGCGGRHCTGYPTWMKQETLRQLERIRLYTGNPITITCGLRCRRYNASLGGSVSNSRHLEGRAVDFYCKGFTGTLSERRKAVAWLSRCPWHNYTYGNGAGSAGAVNAPYMGNALHTDVSRDSKEWWPTNPSVQRIHMREAACIWAEVTSLDDAYGYVYYHKSGKGWNCIGFVGACWALGAKLYAMMKRYNKDKFETLGNNNSLNHNIEENWVKRLGNDWKYKTNNGSLGGKRLTRKNLLRGDILICYDNKGVYRHVALYVGQGYIIDATHTSRKADDIRRRKLTSLGSKPTRAFRYMG